LEEHMSLVERSGDAGILRVVVIRKLPGSNRSGSGGNRSPLIYVVGPA
jgi:hypothetical protein